MSENVRFDATYRATAIQTMRDEILDVLIIGGGITGAGAALDAAARGLKVGLIEQHDIASGTSSKSSKMIHGGLRYLEQLDFSLVKEALNERRLLLTTIAPHLVRPVPFLYPLRYRLWERVYVGAGILLYDRLANDRHLPAGRHLSRSQTAQLAPALAPQHYIGGIQFWDAQEDDARYALCVARTAANYGGWLATRVKCNTLLRDGERVTGAKATDLETGEQFNIRAHHVVTATGAWTGELLRDAINVPFNVRPSIGAHILLPADSIDMHTGLLARTATGLLFVIPWQGQWLVGDTDSDWPHAPEEIKVTDVEVQQLLARLNSVLKRPISAEQIIGAFVGLRPLVSGNDQASTKQLSRHHAIATPVAGLTMIAGGKYTTYRIMAADVIDEVIQYAKRSNITASSTAQIPLIGAHHFAQLQNQSAELVQQSGLLPEQIDRLLHRYGDCIADLLQLIRAQPDLATPVHSSDGVLRVEIAYACSHEGARHLDDVMERRTRMAIQLANQGADVVEEVARIMQQQLNWNNEVTSQELTYYRQRLNA